MDDGTIFAGAAVGIAAAIAAFVQARWRRPNARTGRYVAPVWAAAEVLAKSRGHSELREEHLLAAVLFDRRIEERLTKEKVNVDAVRAELDAHLATTATYRTNEAANVTVGDSLARRVKNLRDDLDVLYAALLEDPTPPIARAMKIGRDTELTPAEEKMAAVLTLKGNFDFSVVVAAIEKHFGLSRAAATYVVETAKRDGRATIDHLPPNVVRERLDVFLKELAQHASLAVIDGATNKRVPVNVKVDKRVELALTLAATLAKEQSHAEVTTSHLLSVLLRRKHIADALTAAGADLAAVDKELESDLATVAKTASTETPVASAGVQRVIRKAVVTGQVTKTEVDLTRVLCTLFDDGDEGTKRAFAGCGLRRGDLLAALLRPPKKPGPKEGEKEIVLYNDDVTTMEQVVSLLRDVFGLDDTTARELMYEVHFVGESVITTMPAQEADALVDKSLEWCASNNVPLRLAAR